MGKDQTVFSSGDLQRMQATLPRPVHGRRSARRWLKSAAIILVIAYLMWCATLFLFQRALIFPATLTPEPSRSVPRYVVEMSVKTERGRPVAGWFIPSSSATPEAPGPAVIYFHGNAEIIDYADRIEGLWRQLDVSLLMAEYRGYGRAREAGRPSQAALVADGVRFFDELARRPDVDPSRIVIHGYSIGGGVAAQVAAQRKPAALILEATFTSVAGLAWSYGVPPFLSRHPFRTDDVLPGLGVPIFISHGLRDNILPVDHGRRLHALVPTSTYVELDCGHLNLPGGTIAPQDVYRDEIRRFLIRSGVLDETAEP